LPSCPFEFAPQQYAVFGVVVVFAMPHVWYAPALTSVNQIPAGADTRVGVAVLVVVPFPSCPRKFAPQQYTDPAVVSAHA